MRKLTIAISVAVALTLALGMFVSAKATTLSAATDVVAAATAPTGENHAPPDKERPMGEEGRRRPAPGQIEQFFRIVLLAAHATEDEVLNGLIDQAIADRKTMVHLEGRQLHAFEELVEAIRGDDKELIKQKHEALQAAKEALRKATVKVHQDLRKIVERLRELRPEGAKEGMLGQEYGDFGGAPREGKPLYRPRRPNKDEAAE